MVSNHIQAARTYITCPWEGQEQTRLVSVYLDPYWTASAYGIPIVGRDFRGPNFAIAALQEAISNATRTPAFPTDERATKPGGRGRARGR